jgi:uncharacterized protein
MTDSKQEQHCESNPIIQSVQFWLEHTIIGFNFCPFAKREFLNQSIHYEVVDDKNPQEQLHSLINECQRLDQHSEIETTLLILPIGLESYFDYLDLLQMAEELLFQEGYEGIYQLASFHPDYCFADVEYDDASNFTNRSPYPIFHLLRESSVEKAVAHSENPELIPERNIELAKQKGSEVFVELLKQSLSHNAD